MNFHTDYVKPVSLFLKKTIFRTTYPSSILASHFSSKISAYVNLLPATGEAPSNCIRTGQRVFSFTKKENGPNDENDEHFFKIFQAKLIDYCFGVTRCKGDLLTNRLLKIKITRFKNALLNRFIKLSKIHYFILNRAKNSRKFVSN